MIRLSEEPSRLVSSFVAFRNDVDVYTEDNQKDKEFYKALLRRLINPNIRLNDVTPLGSRKNVIDRCRAEPENNRRKIFIVDADIFLVSGRKTPELPNLFVLDAYCVENLVLDEASAVEYIYGESGTISKEEIKTGLNFTEWLSSYAR